MSDDGRADPLAFLAGLKRGGADRLTCVPCSSMTGLIDAAIADPDFLFANAPNEGEALGFAAGARLGGHTTAVLCQNSGLGNLANALTSLIVPYRIPILLIVGWRGQPGVHDEPQHRLVGRMTRPFLEACGFGVHIAAARNADDLAETCATKVTAGRQSQAILVPTRLFRQIPDTAAPTPLVHAVGAIERDTKATPPARHAALASLLECLPVDAVIIAPTGLASREIYDLKDSPAHFYMMGSMGHAAAIGLGVAQTTDRPVVVLDGDGSILMRLGTLAFAGAMAPANMLHIVVDNGVHESTGGQASLSSGVDLCTVAAACGYRSSREAGSLDGMESAIAKAFAGPPGPHFVRLFTAPLIAAKPPRIALPAVAIAERFSNDLARTSDAAIDKRTIASAE